MIPNQQFQLDAIDPGATVVGVKDLRQSLHTILLTEKGSQPLQPEYGCGLIGLIGRPISVVVANLHQSIVPQVSYWVPDIEIRGFKVVPSETDSSKIKITVEWRPKTSTQIEELEVVL